ncbi:MAG: phlA [Frankiales bacterium]|nr:phlA [Frankiales bacterium]
MTTWLEIPLPAGDLDEIEHCAALLRRCSRATYDGATQVHRTSSALHGAWEGPAAGAFSTKSTAAVSAITRVADVEGDAARLLDAYAREWQAAHDAAIRAHAALGTAVESYVHAAHAALHGVAAHLEGFLSSAVSALMSLVSSIASEVQHAVARVTSWAPPRDRPVLVVGREHEPVSADAVLRGLTSGGSWGISHLVDAAHGVAHLVGGGIHGALSTVHSVEHEFASAVADAHRLVNGALYDLAAAAKRAAAAVERLAIDVTETVFRAVRVAVSAGAHFAVTLGLGLVHLTHALDEAARGLAAVLLIKSQLQRGQRHTHRMSDSDYRAANTAAALRWATDRSYQAEVVARAQLAKAAYADTGAPAGWERVGLTRHGSDGFAAAVFHCPATGAYVVAFRGTEPNHADDWNEDAQNAAGFSTSQGRQAIAFAQTAALTYGAGDLSFTGHSLGGALAALASLSTGKPATTFNAASVGDGNYREASRFVATVSEEEITNFHATHDILTVGQEGAGLGVASGAQVTLATNARNAVAAHDIEQMVFPHVCYEGQPLAECAR